MFEVGEEVIVNLPGDQINGLVGTVRAGFFGVPAQFGEPVLHTPSTLPGTDFDLEYVFSPSAIPEPGTLVLLCTGVLAIAAARYRSLSKPPAHSARTTPVPPAAVKRSFITGRRTHPRAAPTRAPDVKWR